MRGFAIIGFVNILRPSIRTSRTTDLAFSVVVLTAYFATFSTLREVSSLKLFLLIVFGIGYMSLGVYGYGYVARGHSMNLRLLYFALQIPLGGLIIFFSQGTGVNVMVLLPLVGHSVLLLADTWRYVVNVVILLAYTVAVYLITGSVAETWSGLLLFFAGQVFIVVFTQMAVDEERAREKVVGLVEELEAANQRLREFALQVEELAITRERNRLAREIHDGLGHYLTTINIQLKAAQAVLSNDPARAVSAIDTAQNLAQEALVDVRRSVGALRASPEEDLPLDEQLGRLLARCQAAGVEPHLRVIGTPRPLSPQVHLTLYRAAQEGLNNVCKHAQANHLWAELDYSQPGSVRLFLRDNGQGAHTLDGGFGLLGLRERVHLLNGVFRVESQAGNGVTLEIVVPQDDKENSNSAGG